MPVRSLAIPVPFLSRVVVIPTPTVKVHEILVTFGRRFIDSEIVTLSTAQPGYLAVTSLVW